MAQVSMIKAEEQPIYCGEHQKDRAVLWITVGGKSLALCRKCWEHIAECWEHIADSV